MQYGLHKIVPSRFVEMQRLKAGKVSWRLTRSGWLPQSTKYTREEYEFTSRGGLCRRISRAVRATGRDTCWSNIEASFHKFTYTSFAVAFYIYRKIPLPSTMRFLSAITVVAMAVGLAAAAPLEGELVSNYT
jgi:hypothetical protein